MRLCRRITVYFAAVIAAVIKLNSKSPVVGQRSTPLFGFCFLQLILHASGMGLRDRTVWREKPHHGVPFESKKVELGTTGRSLDRVDEPDTENHVCIQLQFPPRTTTSTLVRSVATR